eukprot:m.262355 g.262355  ORF g.262355 m.262355 type:complete len:460 (+) comp25473_c0_seq1:65-1444(+)
MLSITEAWITERVGLDRSQLGKVRALVLPGAAHEKITHLGTSLLNFTRLKELTLSNNAITSLEGLDHLLYLEKLNLYFNNISDIQELHKLRFNIALKEVDLRLNPVSQAGGMHYRLLVVHMLSALRRLDDTDVRDTERAAALKYFTVDQAFDLSIHRPSPSLRSDQPPDPASRQMPARAVFVESPEAEYPIPPSTVPPTAPALRVPVPPRHPDGRTAAPGPGAAAGTHVRQEAARLREAVGTPPVDVPADPMLLRTVNAIYAVVSTHYPAVSLTLQLQTELLAVLDANLVAPLRQRPAAEPSSPGLPGALKGSLDQLRDEYETLTRRAADSEARLRVSQARVTQLEEHINTLQSDHAAATSELRHQLETLSVELRGAQSEREHLLRRTEQVRQFESRATAVEELASMLRESHRSLTASNDELRLQLARAREEHAKEVDRMRHNFDELLRTRASLDAMTG